MTRRASGAEPGRRRKSNLTYEIARHMLKASGERCPTLASPPPHEVKRDSARGACVCARGGECAKPACSSEATAFQPRGVEATAQRAITEHSRNVDNICTL